MSARDNVREYLEAVVDWLGWHTEDLSYGLRKPEHAVKLYKYWQLNQEKFELPEFCDEPEDDAEYSLLKRHRKIALGYDPLHPNPHQQWAEEIRK